MRRTCTTGSARAVTTSRPRPFGSFDLATVGNGVSFATPEGGGVSRALVRFCALFFDAPSETGISTLPGPNVAAFDPPHATMPIVIAQRSERRPERETSALT